MGSPKFDNLNSEQFEWFIEWLPKIPKSNFHRGMYIVESEGILEYLDIHQLVEWWYYEILKP